jgi:hypothetical protein
MEFERLLKPLKDELSAPETTIGFFAGIGIGLTSAQAATVGSAATATINAVDDLATEVSNIITHLSSEDYGALATDTIHAIQDIATIVNGATTIANTVHGMHSSLPGDEIAKRIINLLIFKYIENAHGVNEGLELFGLLDRQVFNEGSVDPSNPEYELITYRFGRIGDWLSNPANAARDIYDWGKNDFDGAKLFSRLEGILSRMGLPVLYQDTLTPKRLDVVVVEAVPKTDVTPHGLLLRLKNPMLSTTVTIPMGNTMHLDLTLGVNTPKNTGLYALPDGTIAFQPPDSTNLGGNIQLVYTLKKDPPEPFILFGEAGGSRFELGQLVITTGAEVNWNGTAATGDFSFQAEASGLKVVIDASKGDGFLTKIISGIHVEADFDLIMGISTNRGFYFGGSSALEIKLPAHIDLGPIAIEGLTIALKIKDGKIPVELGADIKASLGPLVAVVQNIGITAGFSFPPDNSGNLGPLQMDIGFKPPNGVGLSLDTGVIKGGGFLSLDFDKGEYFGALELTFEDVISLKAIGIINTKMPDGSKGFALLILITTEFTPIQLGFGFTLNGVGGLLGVNRGTDIAALKAGVKSGAIESILFPQDVVANINRIISDLKTIFPITQDHFLIGPMAKLGWGTPTLISLELGILIEIPVPRLVILGVLRCILPTEEAAILQLQVNFDGGIDFDQGLIWFDASLFDSYLLIFTLTGDMALHIGWKDPMFIISVGGFHPAFHEIPSDLTGMKRLGISLLSGDNPRITIMTYFAITSNSVQNGAKVELYAEACGFNVYGFLGYDLLVQFNPFHFVADIYAGLALRAGTDVLAGIDVHCELSGPTPWNANGDASLTILFFTISVGFNVTWGDTGPAQIQETANVLQLLTDAVSDDRNWKADMPSNTNLGVTLKKIELADDKIIIHPFGVLGVSQKIVPLDFTINKFGNKKPSPDTIFSMTYAAGPHHDNDEEFAIANFLQLSDSEKLARKSFEKMKSGLVFQATNASVYGSFIDKDVNYELSYVHRKKTFKAGILKLFGGIFDVLVKGSAAPKSAYSVSKTYANNAPAKVDTPKQQYMVVNTSDLSLYAPGAVADSQAGAYNLHDSLVKDNPSLKGNIQVVSAFELN